jgi:methionyl-tRNA formyltransferase
MTSGMAPAWWTRPRTVTVIVDNPSWILPYAERLVSEVRAGGDMASLARSYDEVPQGTVAFLLGCVGIASRDVLARHRRNLVVHESALPKGRGFSPLTWQILEGRSEIPVCLLEAGDDVDAGPVIYRDALKFQGHELIDEIREALGEKTVSLCRRFLVEASPPEGESQSGEASYYARRRPADSRLDPAQSIAQQFELLRVVDNTRYPAWFELRGHRYKITIEKETP